MTPVSTRFLQALVTSHRAVSRVDVTWADGSTSSNVPVISGQVQDDATAKVRRSLTLEVPPDPRWQLGATVRPYRGVRFIDGARELVPLGVFDVRADEVDLSGTGLTRVTAPDRWSRVARGRFYWPMASVEGATIAAEIRRLVLAIMPFPVSFHDLSGSTQVLAPTVWPRDRDAAVADLATALGCEVFFDVYGDLVLRRVTPFDALPVWKVTPEGPLLGGSRSRSDERTYSAVVVNPTRTDGTAPFPPVVVEDTNPLSPTYAFGPFGQVARFFASPAVTTSDQARDVATQMLRKVAGVQTSMSLSSVVNPALVSGDAILVGLLDRSLQTHIIDAVTIPLTADQPMSIATRSQLPALGDEDSAVTA